MNTTMVVLALGIALFFVMILRLMYDLQAGQLLVGLASAAGFVLSCELLSAGYYGPAIITGSAVYWALLMLIMPEAERGKRIGEANEDVEKATRALDGMVITCMAGDKVFVADRNTGPMSYHYHAEVVSEAKVLLWQAKLERLRLQLVPW